MANKLSYNLFTAKHIKKYLGIDKNKLFYWIQTKELLKPTVVGIGRGKNNYFTLENLATLSLIKILDDYGTELWLIKEILEAVVSSNPQIISKVELSPEKIIGDKKIQCDTLFFYDQEGEMIPADDLYPLLPINIWQAYKKEKELFDEHGFILLVRRSKNKRKREIIISARTRKIDLFPEEEEEETKLTMPIIFVIDLLAIIKDLEEKTGLGF